MRHSGCQNKPLRLRSGVYAFVVCFARIFFAISVLSLCYLYAHAGDWLLLYAISMLSLCYLCYLMLGATFCAMLSLCYLCAIYAISCWGLLFALCYLCAISVLSMLSHAISVLSLCYLSAISLIFLWKLCMYTIWTWVEMVFTCSCICVQFQKKVIQWITSFKRNHAHINKNIYICKNISNTSGVRA